MSFKGSPTQLDSGLDHALEPPQRWWEVLNLVGYDIECEIGRGGMATVYRAIQQSLNRQVAIKVLNHRSGEDHEFIQRFKKEGQILARLLHPNILTIYDIGLTEKNQLFLSVEYLAGGTLKERIRQGLSVEQILPIIQDITKALGYAHQQGVVHRDVKPANILFRYDGTPVLSDFGIARIAESKTINTITGLIIGSPGYMSPEQARGESATIQSDLYSLGIVFYEMLTQNTPYQAENSLALLFKHINEPVPELPKQHIKFQPILSKLLAKNAADRYQNTEELLNALNAVPNNHEKPRSITHRSSTTEENPAAPPARSRIVLGLKILSICLLLSIVVYYSYSTHVAKMTEAAELENIAAQQRHEEMQSLLAQADQQRVDHGNLQTAETLYQQVLSLDPNNTQSLVGLEQISREYEQQAQHLSQSGALQESLDQIKKARALSPENTRLIHLHEQVEQQLAEQKAREAEREQQQQAQLQAKMFLEQAQTTSQAGQLEISLVHVEYGLMLVPDHQALLALREQIREKILAQQRQAELAERRKIEQAEAAQRRREADQFLTRASAHRREGNLPASLQQIDEGLAIVPNHEGLLKLRQEIRNSQAAEQRRQEEARRQATARAAEQRRQEEARRQAAARAAEHRRQAAQKDAELERIKSIQRSVEALGRSLD